MKRFKLGLLPLMLTSMVLVGCNGNQPSSKETESKITDVAIVSMVKDIKTYKLKKNDSLIIREGGKDITAMFNVDYMYWTDKEGSTKYEIDSIDAVEDFEITVYFVSDGVDVDVKNKFYISYRGNISYTLLIDQIPAASK